MANGSQIMSLNLPRSSIASTMQWGVGRGLLCLQPLIWCSKFVLGLCGQWNVKLNYLCSHVCCVIGAGAFDILVYTDKDLEVPEKWNETGPAMIANSQEVKLRSFSTSYHKVDTMVAYKNVDNWSCETCLCLCNKETDSFCFYQGLLAVVAYCN